MDRFVDRRAIVPIIGVVAALLGNALPAAAAADPASSDRVKAIVTFEHRPDKASERVIANLGGRVHSRLGLIQGFGIEIPRGRLKALEHSNGVRHIELDHTLTIAAIPPTGDFEYDNAWGVNRIGARNVHLAGNTGRGVKLGIIDTGIDYIHNDPDDQPYVVDPEFTSNYRGGEDFLTYDGDPMDDQGHGTHVAGIAAAEHNGYLVAGVAPGVDLYALKVLGANGQGDYSGLIAALGWAVDHDLDVVNMSIGGHEVSVALQTAVQNAYAAGLVMVAASGNVNPNSFQELLYGCPVTYPAAYPQVIAVSFTNQSDKLTGYSCTGPEVDFAAPGDQIFSPVPIGPCQLCSPYGYMSLSGTSMASPHVAGTVALILHAGIANGGDPSTLADDVKAHLCATTTVAGMSPTDPRYPKYYGCGIVNANNALIVNPPLPPVGVNHPPVAGADTVTTAEDTPAIVPVLANDTDSDGNPVTVTAASDPPHGAAAVQPDGTVSYTPDANYNGPDSFSYTIGDGAGGTASAAVSITVTAVNDPPVAVDDSLVTTRDTSAGVAVLANDTDVDGDALAVSGTSVPAHGATTVQADGSITYQPAADYSGPDGFDYTIDDGQGGTATGHVAVTVVPVNHPPIAIDDNVPGTEDTPLSIDAAANDTDADGGTLTVTSVGQPSHGTTAIAANGTITYTPSANYHGPDAFDYTVADAVGATDAGLVSVSVASVNDAPMAVADTASTNEDVPVSINVVANDSDVDGDALFPSAVTAPANGTTTIAANGTITYSPSADYFGTDSFSYTVSDGAGGSANATVSVSIAAVNDPPTPATISTSTPYKTAKTILLSSVDGETCEQTFQVVANPAHGTLGTPTNITCAFVAVPYTDYSNIKYTPAAGFSGTDTFTYRTSDGSAWSAPATVTVVVDQPVLLHVGDLDRSTTKSTNTWTAKVTILVHNGAEGAVNGVTVTGTWSNGGTGTITCKTSAAGVCTISKASIPKATTSITFTVTGLSLANGEYVPASNHDPDGDSTGTVIVVASPF